MFHLVTNRELLSQPIEPITVSIKMDPGNEVLKYGIGDNKCRQHWHQKLVSKE